MFVDNSIVVTSSTFVTSFWCTVYMGQTLLFKLTVVAIFSNLDWLGFTIKTKGFKQIAEYLTHVCSSSFNLAYILWNKSKYFPISYYIFVLNLEMGNPAYTQAVHNKTNLECVPKIRNLISSEEETVKEITRQTKNG